MLTGTITDDQAKALAQLLALLRPRFGDDAWGVPGIRAALNQARHRGPAHELAIAAIRCTQGDARTPAVIAMDGPHWVGLPVAESRAPRPQMCPEHHQPILLGGTCAGCRADGLEGTHPGTTAVPDPDHDDVYARGARRARAALTDRSAS